MKAYRKYVVIGCWIAGWMAGGCSSVTVGEAGDGLPEGAIGFTSGMTKAAVTDVAGMGDIRVWGTYTKDESSADVFGTAGQEVHYAGGAWTYSPVRYWILGAEYAFHAVHPAEVTGVTVGNGGIEIKGFDATAGHDLMTATAKGIRYDEVSKIQPVALNFKHLLARVELVGKLDGQSAEIVPGMAAKVEEASLYGMPGTGDYVGGTWGGFGVATTAEAPFASGVEQDLTVEGISVFEEDVLLFPQQVERDFAIYVRYSVNGGEMQEQIIPLNGLVGEFVAGKYYRFTFTVIDEDHILFAPPTVNNWNEATGGIIVVE